MYAIDNARSKYLRELFGNLSEEESSRMAETIKANSRFRIKLADQVANEEMEYLNEAIKVDCEVELIEF